MALEGPIFLVRHGRYDRNTQGLTEEGKGDMARAHMSLVAAGIGSGALILSSTAPRAEESAQLLSTALDESGGMKVVTDETLKAGGLHPLRLTNLDDLLEGIMERAGVAAGHDGLVVVTHAPLIALAITHDILADVDKATIEGGVYPYQPGSWIEPETLI